MFVSQGQYGIICLEDLIHEIYSAGKNFRVANNFLLPFHLSVPRHGARDKVGLLKDVGDPGPRAEDINRVIRKLNWANGLSWNVVLSPSRCTKKRREQSISQNSRCKLNGLNNSVCSVDLCIVEIKWGSTQLCFSFYVNNLTRIWSLFY